MIDIGPEIAHGQWSPVESQQSSTWRELEAVKRILSSWAHKLVNENVKWFTDNQGVVSVIQHGSSKDNLQQIALEIFGICMNHAIRLEVEWIPREWNEQADYISNLIDYDDWSLNPKYFRLLEQKWGPHDVDRFACYYTLPKTD